MDILKALNIKNKNNRLPLVQIPQGVETKELSYNGETVVVPLGYYNQVKQELTNLFSKEYVKSSLMDSVLQKSDKVIAYDITYTIPVTTKIVDKLTRYNADDYLYEISLNEFPILVGSIFGDMELDTTVSLLLTQVSDPRYTQGRNNLSFSFHIEINSNKQEDK